MYREDVNNMKKWILLFLVIFGNCLIFSNEISNEKLYSNVLKIENDNYDTVVGIPTHSKEELKAFIMGKAILESDRDRIYKNISKNANKVTLIYFDSKDNSTIKEVVKLLKKKKFKGQVEVITFFYNESKSLSNMLEKNGWTYSGYSEIDNISGTVMYDGAEKPKSEVIKIFLEKIKRTLENNKRIVY